MTQLSRLEELAALAEQVADVSAVLLEAVGVMAHAGQSLQAINQQILTLAREEDQRREATINHLTNVVSLRPNT